VQFTSENSEIISTPTFQCREEKIGNFAHYLGFFTW